MAVNIKYKRANGLQRLAVTHVSLVLTKAGIGGVIVREFAIVFLLTLPRPGRVEQEINKSSRHQTPKIPPLVLMLKTENLHHTVSIPQTVSETSCIDLLRDPPQVKMNDHVLTSKQDL